MIDFEYYFPHFFIFQLLLLLDFHPTTLDHLPDNLKPAGFGFNSLIFYGLDQTDVRY